MVCWALSKQKTCNTKLENNYKLELGQNLQSVKMPKGTKRFWSFQIIFRHVVDFLQKFRFSVDISNEE